jgi:hypothetical protein
LPPFAAFSPHKSFCLYFSHLTLDIPTFLLYSDLFDLFWLHVSTTPFNICKQIRDFIWGLFRK